MPQNGQFQTVLIVQSAIGVILTEGVSIDAGQVPVMLVIVH